MKDEELQNKIEKGVIGEGLDEKAYRVVFDTLKREPSYQLPSNFATRVLRRVQAVPQPSSSREMIWLYAGLISFVVVAGISMALTDFKINFGVFKFISGYPGLIAFGILFVLSLQWIDKRFIKKPTVN